MKDSSSFPLSVLVAVTFLAGVIVSAGLSRGMAGQNMPKSVAVVMAAGAQP